MTLTDRIVHLVDDDEAIRRSASFMLKTSGFIVQTFVSGSELLKQRELAPGCILLDVRMPDMDGIEVQQALHARGVTFPVIVMTGHGDIDVAVQAMKHGVSTLLKSRLKKRSCLLRSRRVSLGSRTLIGTGPSRPMLELCWRP